VSRRWPTVRARLTLLYTGLFAGCGAIVVAVSYTQVARLRAQAQPDGRPPAAGGPSRFVAQCWSAERTAHPDPHILAKCAAYFQQLGAQASVTLPCRICCSTR
jgi:hypothetical protein